MNRSHVLIAALCCLSIAAGCDTPFTPKGSYSDNLVVYGILTNRSDTQYVRVYSTYNPSGVNPLEQTVDPGVSGARIVVAGGPDSSLFQEITATRLDKSRYADNILAYASYPFPIEMGKTYSLNVSSKNGGGVTATVRVPKRGRIQFLNAYILNGGGDKDENIVVYGFIRELTYGIMMKLYLYYDVLEGNAWVRHKDEIPTQTVIQDDGTEIDFYPTMRKRQSSGLVQDKEENELFVFHNNAYYGRIGKILTRYGIGKVHIVKALLVLTQVDKDLYAYSKRVNGFEDPYSIRTDLPDYTNISGGHGIFGAMIDDSAYVNITAW